MKQLLQSPVILLLFVCVRCADLAIISAMAHQTIRSIVYGVVSLLALIALILALIA